MCAVYHLCRVFRAILHLKLRLLGLLKVYIDRRVFIATSAPKCKSERKKITHIHKIYLVPGFCETFSTRINMGNSPQKITHPH